LERNIARDLSHVAALRIAGWKSLVIWECETDDEERMREETGKVSEEAVRRAARALRPGRG
jgi:G:T-mismatch repair DNA endonuclease (very short patch repair protein)